MTERIRPPRVRLSRGAFVLAVFASSAASAEEPAPTGVLTVKLTSLRSNDGRIGCMVFDGPQGFPVDHKAARQERWCDIKDKASSCAFDPLPRGTYAVACFHDENNNGKLDQNFLGIPTEGTVASNHAKGRLGPPKFEDAKFAFSGQPTELVLHMSY